MKMNEYLPDISELPDSEAKREVENLAHEFEGLLEKLVDKEIDDNELHQIHAEASKVWYKMNAKVGKIFEQQRERNSSNNKFYISLVVSILALAVSIFALWK